MFSVSSALTVLIVLFSLVHYSDSFAQRDTDKVCSDVDVRNRVESFSALANCTIVEGYLRIVLIENDASQEFDRISFPALREITGYLLLYRVYKLRSLAHLFPNLSVIRGHSLFFNYAIVIFENDDLVDLGLRSLTRIARGAVRIEKNPQLCYINTIDWSYMTSESTTEEHHFIRENRDPNQCANSCPSINGSDASTSICHKTRIQSEFGETVYQPLCWTATHCQIVCPMSCNGCLIPSSPISAVGLHQSSSPQCCHPECLGGCTGPSEYECMACVHVMRDGRCLRKCPPGTYEYQGWHCVTSKECSDQGFLLTDTGHCEMQCPPGSVIDPNNRTQCKVCEGQCPKVCTRKSVIDSVQEAGQLKGCTVVDNLNIQMRGGVAEAELEESLGSIEEITNSLKVMRSSAIKSLRFLKSLRVIHGRQLHDRYSVVVYDNNNLHELWDFRRTNLTIKQGKVSFHFNPKLCVSLVYDLVAATALRSVDSTDVSPTTNGNQIACNVNLLTMEVMSISSMKAEIRWQNDNNSLSRKLQSWVVYYREAMEENVTVFDARDACGSDVWRMIDVKPVAVSVPYVEAVLQDLEPFTKYAVYIQMYTEAAESSAMSPVKYFTTSPSRPSLPRNVQVTAGSSNELHVTWDKPVVPNGIITHYIVYWRLLPLHTEKWAHVDFCTESMHKHQRTKSLISDRLKNARNTSSSVGPCCDCKPKASYQQQDIHEERNFQIEFENYLHNSVYHKRPLKTTTKSDDRADPPPTEDGQQDLLLRPDEFDNDLPDSRVKRSLEDHKSSTRGTNSREIEHPAIQPGNFSDNVTYDSTRELDMYEMAFVFGKNELVLTNLRHYQDYSIEIVACNDYDMNNNMSRLCSGSAFSSGKTLKNVSADAIDLNSISISRVDYQANTVSIAWSSPPAPNGLILMHHIEFVRGVSNYMPDEICITPKEFLNNSGYTTKRMAPGNWSVRIRATSLAGEGPWTDRLYFDIISPETGEQMGAGAIAGLVVGCFVVFAIIMTITAIFVVRKRWRLMMNEDRLYVLSPNPHYITAEEAYFPDEWEIPREKIEIGRELGQGSFGMVCEGIAKDVVKGMAEAKVAVKMVNSKASVRDRIAFLNEASVMKQFDCHHVVKLVGIVSKGRPTLVIMELMANSDLKSFLRSHRPDNDDDRTKGSLNLAQILQMAGEIADGMTYLCSKKFVHRDLAARNCMVAEDMTVKIGDFGMARDVYGADYYRKGTRGLLPVRWMAPESLKDGVFTSLSDVWSFGVVLWEMVTFAAQPYQGMANEQVLHYVIAGGIMEMPVECPDKLYELMLLCWRHNPSHRPSFDNIIERLCPDLSDRFRVVSYYFNRHEETATENDVETNAVERSASQETLALENNPIDSVTSPQKCVAVAADADANACLQLQEPAPSNEASQQNSDHSSENESSSLLGSRLKQPSPPAAAGPGSGPLTSGANNKLIVANDGLLAASYSGRSGDSCSLSSSKKTGLLNGRTLPHEILSTTRC